MKSRWLIPIGTVLVAAAILGWVFISSTPKNGASNSDNMRGSLFVSDAGQSHGGFEYTASYNLTIHAQGHQGTLTANLSLGLGDTLTKHQFSVTDLEIAQDKVTMKLDGQTVELLWTSSDTVWNHQFDNYYIASWGPAAPSEELKGSVSPSIFAGVPLTYYVEIRLAQS